ncbi:MAG: hypothetical protein LBB30_02040 [Candidatus Methanoplasma sp.]|jgi:hypothetical protein|nr:hypothetical protein [Candidatus Methanoplasma sp.]
MKLDRRGDLGFPEAIMAAMIVTLSLTMYMGLFVLSSANDGGGPEVRVDHRIFGGLTLEDGEIVGDIEMRLITEAERHGFRGITIICEVPGDLGFEGRRIAVGSTDGSISSERFLLSLKGTDGRTVPAVIEVAVCV